MDYNRNGGKKPDSVSPLSQSADDFVSKLEHIKDIPNFVGLCEFDKEELDYRDTLLVQVRGIAWYVETEDGVKIQEDDSNVFVVMEDTLPENQNISELTGQQHAEIGERLGKVIERHAKTMELCTLQFRILIRQKRRATKDSLN